MSEFLANSPEVNESALVNRRLSELQNELASAYYGGSPLYFLGGLECELYLETSESGIDVFASRDYTQTIAQGVKEKFNKRMFVPDDEVYDLLDGTSAEERINYDQLRIEAYNTISSLEPQNREEYDKQQRWLANIETFTPTDFINFRLYQEFSTPTLGPAAPQKGATYEQLCAENEPSTSWLEFRFGNGTLQEGYYDNKNVVEYRLSPCPPDELARREKIITDRFVAIAAEHNTAVFEGGSHLNVSLYSPGKDGQAHPVIGPQRERLAGTIHTVAGIAAGIEQGAWMSEKNARDSSLFGAIGKNEGCFIAPDREVVRLQEDYVELRAPAFKTSTAHGLLWMMAAMSYGYHYGYRHLKAEGHDTTYLIDKVMVERTPQFNKHIDLQLLRTIEESTLFEGVLHHNKKFDRSYKNVASIYGEQIDDREAIIIDGAIVKSLRFDRDGRFTVDDVAFTRAYQSSYDLLSNVASTPIQRTPIETLLNGLKSFLQRDALRANVIEVVVANPIVPGLEPNEWLERWNTSPIRRRAFGIEANREYSAKLESLALEHYEPLDLTDSAAVLKRIQEAIAKKRQSPW